MSVLHYFSTRHCEKAKLTKQSRKSSVFCVDLVRNEGVRGLRFLLAVYVMLSAIFASQAHALTGEPVKRSVLAVYDAVLDGSPAYTRAHKLFEMPLNHLGYTVDYANIHDPLPENVEHYAAILIALNDNTLKQEQAIIWLNWLKNAQEQGLKIILLGDLGITDKAQFVPQVKRLRNKVMNHLGVFLTDGWANVTYNTKLLYTDKRLLNFERRLGGVFPQYPIVTAVDGGKSHLKVNSGFNNEGLSDLIITHPNGGFAASGYMIYEHMVKDEVKYNQWYMNPFLFLSDIMGADSIPKADVTTLYGRRVFYTHIDGDGWNNFAEFRESGARRRVSAEVFRDEIIQKYPQFPFTVSVIGQEVMPQCYGLPQSEQIARDIFALPNVEPASHTHSHPLYWGFFADYTPEKEKPYLDKYPQSPSKKFFLSRFFEEDKKEESHYSQRYKPEPGVDPQRGIISPYIDEAHVMKEYKTPRSFACSPFALGDEVEGSIRYIEELAGGKKVKLYQWSGDTRPFEAALAEVRLNGIYNLNGGGSRYDVEAPSYTLIAPIGVKVGKERQIYSSNTNENDYTNLWTDRFFGFRYLKSTVENTETPVRVHPFNIYFHSYSAQKQASFNALKENFEYAALHPLFPVYASRYAAMANDFYKIKFTKLAPQRWLVQNRGQIQTIRFDKSSLQAVDINESKGVLGYKYLHGSLYVSLDKAVNNPIITLIQKNTLSSHPTSKYPYLIDSNWEIKNLKYIKNKLTFRAAGLQTIDMRWKQPSAGQYQIEARDGETVIFTKIIATDSDNFLHIHQDIAKKNAFFIITPKL